MASEIDVKVAEVVMGWLEVGCKHIPSGQPDAGTEFVPHGVPPVPPHPLAARRQTVPDYSSDISAAWLVVEKMRERGFTLSIHTDYIVNDCLYEYCCIVWTNTGGRDFSFEIGAETAPLAICRAALAALKGG